MEIYRATSINAARWAGIFMVASVLQVACIPQSHRLEDQARALRWQQDSVNLVSRIGAVSNVEGQLQVALRRLDSTVQTLTNQRDSLLVEVRNQTRRGDTLYGLVQRESVLRDLLRMDLASAQRAELVNQKRVDSLKLEVQFLTEKLNARPARPVQPRPAPTNTRSGAPTNRPAGNLRPPQ